MSEDEDAKERRLKREARQESLRLTRIRVRTAIVSVAVSVIAMCMSFTTMVVVLLHQ